jgi:uncharacterized protein (TIGR00375 family)
MKFIADLHIHSKYSRATSKQMSPESLWKWAQFKGIKVLGAGDFTHPEWFSELRAKLEPAQGGLFGLKKEFRQGDVFESCQSDVFFMLSAEISCIYSKRGKTRKIHCIVFAPDFAGAARINKTLSGIGNLSSDGRPILGLDAKELLRIVTNESPEAVLVPAHAWTPHFSIFGAMSGFDALEECFEELTFHIRAIETGLSSDPSMNWRLSALDNITLISNSDAHSPSKLGREANIFDAELSYEAVMDALKTGEGFLGTIEFFPEEGKYHYDGHRACSVCLSPEETIKYNYLCPSCGKKITVGVMHRVEKLADRENGFRPGGAPDYYSIIPLAEIIAETLGVGVNSKAVERMYFTLLNGLGNEFRILIDTPFEDIERAGSSLLADAVSKVRSHEVQIAPGFDGEFGKIRIFEGVERKEIKGQERLF